jgi:hypothetical protein
MTAVDRRRFLSTLGSAGALLASGSWLEALGYAQTGERRARALIQQARAAPFDRRLEGIDSGGEFRSADLALINP